MKAKSKPLAQKTPADYGVDMTPRLDDAEGQRAAQARRPASRSTSVDELVAKLKALGVGA